MTAALSDRSITKAIQQIEANGKAWSEMNNRVQNDTRYRMLMAVSLALTDAPVNSAASLFAACSSSAYWRGKRAGDLAIAREGQIKRKPGYTRAWLKRAAEHRRAERMYQVSEHMSAGADAIAGALIAQYMQAAE